MFPKCVFRWGDLNIDIKLVYIVVSVQLNTKAMMTLDWRQRSSCGSKFQQEYCAGRGRGAQHKLGSRYRQLCLLWTSIQLQQLFSHHISPSLSFCSKYHRASFLYNTENVFQFGLMCLLYCTKLIQTSSSNVSYMKDYFV